MPTELGQILRNARRAAGLTQRELAERLGVANGTVQQWEMGIRVPRYETLQRLEDILHIALVPSNLNPVAQPAHPTELTPKNSDPADNAFFIPDNHDIAFYNGYKELSEDDKETIRRMVEVMRERRKKPPQD